MVLGRVTAKGLIQPLRGMPKMELDPKLELIVMIIKNTELDCCMWDDSIQRELAVEILEALERRYTIEIKE